MLWWLFGHSWVVFRGLLLFLFVLSGACLYGLFRLGLGRLLSVPFTLWCVFAPGYLWNVMNLRDFSRVPAMLGVMLFLAVLVKYPVRSRALPWLGALLGLIHGVALGFRMDILVCLLPSVVVLLLFARGVTPLGVTHRLAAVAFFLVAFGVSALPVYWGMQVKGSTTSHHIAGGFAAPLEDVLGVTRASHVRLAHCNDKLIFATASAYARHHSRITEDVQFISPAGAAATNAYVAQVFKLFPGDMYARGLAGVQHVLNGAGQYEFAAEKNPFSRIVWRGDRLLTKHLLYFKYVYAAASLLLLAAIQARYGWAALLFLLYFCAYICLQFQYRHIYHLYFIPLWMMGFLAYRAADGARLIPGMMRESKASLATARPALLRMALLAASTVILLAVPLLVARGWQTQRVHELWRQYRQAPLQSVTAQVTEEGTAIRIRPDAPIALSRESLSDHDGHLYFHDALLAAEFEPGSEAMQFWLLYESGHPEDDFTTLVHVHPTPRSVASGENVRVFFPVFETAGYQRNGNAETGWNRFTGLLMAPEDYARFRGLFAVGGHQTLPMLLHFTAPPAWEDVEPVQRLTFLGDAQQTPLPRVWPEYDALHQGREFLMAGEIEKAVRAFEEARIKDPENAEVAYGLARALLQSGNLPEALQASREAMRLAPAVYTLHAMHDRIVRSLPQDQRLPEWEFLAQDCPNDPLPMLYLALHAFETGNDDLAAQALENAATAGDPLAAGLRQTKDDSGQNWRRLREYLPGGSGL
jgi:tetratricopeptide (TPR) repeat protein